MALLSRNIKVMGQEYGNMNEESFGARVLVGTYSWAGVDYKGKFSVSDMTHINAAKCQHVILTHYCFVFFFFFSITRHSPDQERGVLPVRSGRMDRRL